MPLRRVAVLALLFASGPGPVRADDPGARQITLWYENAPVATTFLNEVTVRKSANSSYFAVCGWTHGYFGIQQLEDGAKVILFSVWDPNYGEDPAAVPAEKQVRVLFRAPAVRVGRFGNEGTGAQGFFDFAWRPGVAYRFAVTARPDGPQRTAYTGWFRLPAKKWKRLVTFSTLTRRNEGLRGLYSFVEDFARTRESEVFPRRAVFGNGWVQSATGRWKSLDEAQFAADETSGDTIDAGPAKSGFFLATGGDTPRNAGKLGQTFTRPSNLGPPMDAPPGRN